MREYSQFNNLNFVREKSFRTDVLAVLGGINRASWSYKWIDLFERRSELFSKVFKGVLPRFFLHVPPAVLFVVDDTIFLRPFVVRSLMQILLKKPSALALSLRLGENKDYFYMGNRSQLIPVMQPLVKELDLSVYKWPGADGDYGYPIEISSSILKMKLLINRLLRKEWKSPNTLELALARMAGRYEKIYPEVLTFRVARAVSVPLNVVQKDFVENRFAQTGRSSDELCEMFFRGIRADLSSLSDLSPRAVHIELNLVPAI
jgi:hypothetical protein